MAETKNMKGWIFGNSKQRYWTQKAFKCARKFPNSLHQNYKHVQILQSLLGLGDEQVHSLVVFVGESTFKTPMPDNVIQGLGFIRFIKAETHTSVELTTMQVKKLVEGVSWLAEAYLANTSGSCRACAGNC